MKKKNIFKDKNILILRLPIREDGSAYKMTNCLVNAFGLKVTYNLKKYLEDNQIPDLIICWGDRHTSYKECLEARIPYLLIEHDIASYRYGLNEKTYAHDKELMENASAVIFTSEGYIDYFDKIKNKYKWDLPKYTTIHNKPLKKDITFIPRDKLEGLHLVVDGGIIAQWERKNNPYHYKAYHFIFRKFIEAGWKVHIYPTKFIPINKLPEYEEIGCILHNWIPGEAIYQEMSQYTAGFQGFNSINTPESAFQFAQACRPNKIYDFLGAGIPTIGYQGGDGMEIYRDKWGIVIDDLEPETLAAIPERLKKIKITEKMRNDNVLEKERDKFEYIINVALKEAKNKDRKIYNIDKNPFRVSIKNPFEKKYPIKITVENKTPSPITRINRIFLPKSISEVFSVDKMDYKQLRAHINLIIKEVEV